MIDQQSLIRDPVGERVNNRSGTDSCSTNAIVENTQDITVLEDALT